MAGSRKGEKRGAAGRGRRRASHETGAEIIREALRPGARPRREIIERRLEIARVINGEPKHAADMSMKEMMAAGAAWHMEAAQDWKRFLHHHMMIQPATKESTAAVMHAEHMVAHHLAQCTDHAYKAAPYMHAKLAAVLTKQDVGDSARSIMDDLMDDIDERMREQPGPLIEHEPLKKSG